MDKEMARRLLEASLRSGWQTEITVTGVSMNPTLYEGDTVAVQKCDDYDVGDILVFTYKDGSLLVHRLLKKDGLRYYCKGDNAFRLEDVTINQIAGKVVSVNGASPPEFSAELIRLSYLVNREFRRLGYDTEKVKKSSIYLLYNKTIGKGEKTMKDKKSYRKNADMEYIQTDETSLAVFDPESGDTHFFDEVGISILDSLDEECSLDELLDKLCGMYDATPDMIRSDVEEFLSETVEKKVVLEI